MPKKKKSTTKRKPRKASKPKKVSPKIKKVKKVKVSKPKPLKLKINKIPINQLENLKGWLDHHKDTGKFPHNRIVCNVCKIDFVSLKGIAMSHAMKKFDGDIKRILTESICKNCKPKPDPTEKKEKEPTFISREEWEERRERVRETLPKFKPYEQKLIDLTKDKDYCKKITQSMCWRPDIYLDLGCDECPLKKNCVCSIKDVNRIADGRGKKRKK